MEHWNTTTLATQLMSQHGLSDWTFKYDHAKRRAGVCKYGKKVISLSIHYVLRNNEEDVKDTILHEIAHALAGRGMGHGPVWKKICLRIGAKPVRCYGKHISMPEPRLKALCPHCQQTFRRHRQPRRQCYCRKCGRYDGLLTFA